MMFSLVGLRSGCVCFVDPKKPIIDEDLIIPAASKSPTDGKVFLGSLSIGDRFKLVRDSKALYEVTRTSSGSVRHRLIRSSDGSWVNFGQKEYSNCPNKKVYQVVK